LVFLRTGQQSAALIRRPSTSTVARDRGDYRSAAAFAREGRLNNEQLAQLQGDLTSGSTVNIGISTGGQDNLQVAIAILRALQPYPEARQAALSGAGIGVTLEAEPLGIEDGAAEG
jgi:hypothetical protein